MLSHQAIAGGPLVLASVGREQILDMLNKVLVYKLHVAFDRHAVMVMCVLFSSSQMMLEQ